MIWLVLLHVAAALGAPALVARLGAQSRHLFAVGGRTRSDLAVDLGAQGVSLGLLTRAPVGDLGLNARLLIC